MYFNRMRKDEFNTLILNSYSKWEYSQKHTKKLK